MPSITRTELRLVLGQLMATWMDSEFGDCSACLGEKNHLGVVVHEKPCRYVKAAGILKRKLARSG